MNNSTIYVTEEGFRQYHEQLQIYKAQYIELLRTRAEYGINSKEDYKTAAFDQSEQSLLSDISNISQTIARLEIIKNLNIDENLINLNDIVTVQFLEDGEILEFQLTGEKPSAYKNSSAQVSINSPLGKSIHGKHVGDIVTFNVFNSDSSVIILSKQTSTRKSTSTWKLISTLSIFEFKNK